MSAEQDKHDRGRLQHDAEHERPHRRGSVLFYLVILFAAAFLLLLMSYFAQQRANEAAIDDLEQTSSSAVQTLDQILSERDQLKEQAEELEARNQEQTAELERRAQEAGALTRELEAQARALEAMQWFWQIDDYYARGYYTQARQLIEEFEGLGLADSLPGENTTTTDRFSPAQRYGEIFDALD